MSHQLRALDAYMALSKQDLAHRLIVADHKLASIHALSAPPVLGSLPSGESDPVAMQDHGGAETCPTCRCTDERYKANLSWAGCTDHWHDDAHLRRRASETTKQVQHD